MLHYTGYLDMLHNTGYLDMLHNTGYLDMLHNTGYLDSAARLKGDLYAEARDFCGRQGKDVQPVETHANEAGYFTYPHAEPDFRCVTAQ
jgi:hypothetical protein